MAGRDLARLLGWTLSLALLGLDGAGHSLHAASPTRRPAQLQIPRNARPLPPREPSAPREQVYPRDRAAERERLQQREAEYQYDRDFEEEVRVEGVEGVEGVARVEPTRTRPVSTERMENHSVRSRPAVVRLTLLDEGDSSHPRNLASAGGDRWETSRQLSAPVPHPTGSHRSEINRVAYQDRTWTRRSDASGGEAGFAREGIRQLESSSNAFDDPVGDRRSAVRSMTLAPARNSYRSYNDQAGARTSSLPSHRGSTGTAFFQENKASSDCERVYNDRNCCDDDAICQQARQRLLRSPISAISLDISPRFNPTSQDTGRLPDRERTFEEETRDWRNRSGQRVAQGSLVGIEHGRVLVRLTNGSIERIPLRQLSDDDICYFAAWWGVPNVCTLGDDMYADRHFAPLTMTWKASALCHKPLYFEEVQLERYGHTTGPLVQPALSGAHFFLNIAALPYRAGINPPTECQYSLGYYRPGSCAPWMVPPIPLSVRGALMQAGAVVGGVAVIP